MSKEIIKRYSTKTLRTSICLFFLAIGIIELVAAVPDSTPSLDIANFLVDKGLSFFFGILSLVFSWMLKRVFEKFDHQDKKMDEMREKQNRDFIDNLNKINSETNLINRELSVIRLDYITKTDFNHGLDTIHKKLDEITNEKRAHENHCVNYEPK